MKEIIKANWNEDLAKIMALFIKTDPKDYRFYVELKDFIQDLLKANQQELDAKYRFGLRNLATLIKKETKEDLLKKIEEKADFVDDVFCKGKSSLIIGIDTIKKIFKEQ